LFNLGMYFLLLGRLEESRDCLRRCSGPEDGLTSSTRLLNKIDSWLTIDSPHLLGSNRESRLSQLEKFDRITVQLARPEIRLEPLLLAHTDAVYELATPEILDMTRLPAFLNRTDAMNWIRSTAASPDNYTFAITHRAFGFTGVASVTVVDKSGHFFFWIGEPFWGKGLATAGACQLLRFAFDELALEDLFTSVFHHNQRSVRIMHKLGFSCVSIARRDLDYYRCGLSALSEHEAASRLRRLFLTTRSNLMNQSNNTDGG